MKKKAKGKEGTAVNYTTRNQALVRLQIKLPEFRRLCILKGIHPREPKRKVHGHNKTYYHVKDINFLAHEPLLEKGRELKVHERKLRKAKGKLDEALAERVKQQRPSYTLDHLVKERYPSFIDALRDLDDALSMLHLFASLPADSTHKIPVESVHAARRLSLEWQAYVTRTNALRKTFVSVKGTYYQAEVAGQKITWLVPHPLSQVIPSDVDFRVMLTFLEFYETLMSFTNFKLYHELGLAYPPILDQKLEQAAADLFAVMSQLARPSKQGESDPALGSTQPGVSTGEALPEKAGGANESAEETSKQVQKEELLQAESAARLASLQSRLSAMGGVQKKVGGAASEQEMVEADGGVAATEEEEGEDEETSVCRKLFQGLVFFLSREVPRESLLLVIRAFGGTASWEGEGAPFSEDDDAITHQVVDRPSQKHRHLSREYVQPQWAYDCSNARLILPTAPYGPGLVPPPHLSPFVDNEAEGYVPEYAEAIDKLKAGQEGVAALPDAEDELVDVQEAIALRSEDAAAAAKRAELVAEERTFIQDLSREAAGVLFSASLETSAAAVGGEGGETRGAGGEEGERGLRKMKVTAGASEADDEAAMAQMMMPRKKKKLYDAMQMGKEKKKAGVNLLVERKRKAVAQGVLEKKRKQ